MPCKGCRESSRSSIAMVPCASLAIDERVKYVLIIAPSVPELNTSLTMKTVKASLLPFVVHFPMGQ